MGVIYKITNKINGKFYIGQTTRKLEYRWREHCHDALNGSQTYFHAAIKKYGKENFILEIIDENVDNSKILEVESKYIEELGSNKKEIGYNTTLDKKYTEKKILDFNIIDDIIGLITNTSLSLSEIGKMFGLCRSTISHINKGIIYKKSDIEYPIRSIAINRKLNEFEVLEIIEILSTNKKMSMYDIAEIYDIHHATIGKINNGICYYKYMENLNLSFPIRKEQSDELDFEFVKNVVYKELIDDKNKSLTEISKKINVPVYKLSKINNGETYRSILSDKYPDIKFPIKNIGYTSKIKDDDVLYEIVELLKYTSLTLNQITYVIKQKYEYDSTNTLYKINSGIRYKKRVIDLFDNIHFPIRSQSNKRIVFSNEKDKKKENEILKKYDIAVEDLPLPFGEKIKI